MADLLADLTDDLIRDEGEKLSVYPDSRGFWTIGVGVCVDKRAGCGLTPAESRYLLVNRINSTLVDLDRDLPWWRAMPANWQRGLANMAYNLGINKLLGFHVMLDCLQDGDGPGASAAALSSLWGRQVGDRAKRIAELFKNG
jgi:lysozyme